MAKEKKLRFFAFGCDHDYRDMTEEELNKYGRLSGSCIHHYICTKCGNINIQDSSD